MALLMFTGKECDHCHEMLPLVERLEKEEDIKVEQIEVWHNAENKKKLDSLDKGECGGVPFFYNEETKENICGSTEYENLKKWAKK